MATVHPTGTCSAGSGCVFIEAVSEKGNEDDDSDMCSEHAAEAWINSEGEGQVCERTVSACAWGRDGLVVRMKCSRSDSSWMA